MTHKIDATTDQGMFSVVIPSFDRIHTVERAIQSALDQSLQPLEVIVVDDGSNDGTYELLQSLPAPVRAVRQAHTGVAGARNRGALEARAEWLAFLDSDDYWVPDHLERLARAIVATSGASDLYFDDTSIAWVTHDNRDERSLRTVSLWEFADFQPRSPHLLVADATSWVTMTTQPTMLQSSAIRRTAYLSIGGVSAVLPVREDTHLFLRLGLGRAACAVAGIGARMTDDAGDERLTRQLPPTGLPYWIASAFMYDDVVRTMRRDDPARRDLVGRAAMAHWRVARLALRERRVGAAIRSLVAVHRRRPSFVVGRAWAKVRSPGQAGSETIA